jgi:hypothetical protein
MHGYGVLVEWCWWQKTVLEGKHVSVPLCPPKFHMTQTSVVKDQWLPEIWHGHKSSSTLPAHQAGVVSGQIHILAALSLHKKAPGTHLRTMMRGEKFLVPAKNWRPVCVLVTLPTELPWLTLPCISYIDKHPTVAVAARLYGNTSHVLCKKDQHSIGCVWSYHTENRRNLKELFSIVVSG